MRTQEVPVVGGPTETELTGHVSRQTTLSQVVAGGASVRRREQPLVVPLDGGIEGFHQLLATLTILALAARRVVECDSRTRGQLFDGLHEVDVIDLLHELEHVTGGLTPEALVPTRVFTNVERTTLLRVERTQTHPVAAHTPQSDRLLDDFDDRCSRAHPLDVVLDDRHGRRLTLV